MRFTFATPTAIMKHAGNGVRFTALYPDPLTLFGGLAWRWRALVSSALSTEIEGFLLSCSSNSAGLQQLAGWVFAKYKRP